MNTATTENPTRIFELVRASLAELFEIDPTRVTPETGLFDELNIDSIDAVDLMLKVERTLGRKIAAEEFHSVRTVGDLVQAIARMQQG